MDNSGIKKEFFDSVSNFSDRAQALREKLITVGLHKTGITIIAHAPNAPSILQTISHEEPADYLEEAQRLLSRLDRQVEHDEHSIQTVARAAAANALLGNLERRTDDLM